MENELLPLIRELCYIAVSRNEINTRRHRARYRKQYYTKALRVVEAHKGSNSRLRTLQRESYKCISKSKEELKLISKIHQIESEMLYIIKCHPNPKKWMAMGPMKLRSLILKAESDYCLAKHETMELSLRTTDRVKDILDKIKAFVCYDNGSICCIRFFNMTIDDIGSDQMIRYAREHVLDEAVTKMLQE